jgi:hypothetical protein
MISAKEARNIALTSHKNVERVLERLDVLIRKAAESGEGPLVCEEPNTYLEYEAHRSCPEPTPLMTRLMERLKGYGFLVELTYIGPYAPAGLGSVEDDTERMKMVIQIRW